MQTIRCGVLLALVAGSALPALAQSTDDRTPEHPERRRSSLVQRPAVVPAWARGDRGTFPERAVYPDEFRTIDGWGNNPDSPWFGSVGMPMIRKGPIAYDDMFGDMPARSGGPSARLVSNTVVAQSGSIPNTRGASDYLWQWGQFVDHDIDETPIASPAESMDIEVPAGDPWFDPSGTGAVTIALDRSAYEMVEGVRQQVNNITAYIDASMVYGSEHDLADELRAMDGTGRLKTSPGNLLPFNVNGFPNAPTADDPSFFLAGDIRCNEQVGLTAMHTLFMREHNHWAGVIAGREPGLSGDEIYERARAIVAAEVQAITYNEFLPMLLGPDAIPPYTGYDPSVDAGIANSFAAAAYRVGHTMLSTTLRRVDASGDEIAGGHLSLSDAFFSPQEVIDHGIDPVLRGLAIQRAQQIDNHVIDDVRNFLFGPPGAGGFDLASLNIQRGRDHGVCGYNELRVAHGLPALTDFSQVTPDTGLAADLASVYETVDDIDPWIGLLAEPHAPGAMVGQTLRKVLGDQFTRLRDGDRFWYETYLPPMMVRMVNQQSLSRIIRRNTGIRGELPGDVFLATECPADVNGDGVVDLADVQAFTAAFLAGDSSADLNIDGVFDLADLHAFVLSFNAGCP